MAWAPATASWATWTLPPAQGIGGDSRSASGRARAAPAAAAAGRAQKTLSIALLSKNRPEDLSVPGPGSQGEGRPVLARPEVSPAPPPSRRSSLFPSPKAGGQAGHFALDLGLPSQETQTPTSAGSSS